MSKITNYFHPEYLESVPNDIAKIVPDADSTVIRYYDMTGRSCRLIQDMQEEHLVLFFSSP